VFPFLCGPFSMLCCFCFLPNADNDALDVILFIKDLGGASSSRVRKEGSFSDVLGGEDVVGISFGGRKSQIL